MMKRLPDLMIPNANSIIPKESFPTSSKSYPSLKIRLMLLLAKRCRCNLSFDDDEIFVNTENKA
ncbi:unnamed protein product [Wuchereria bancrofti]|uniref:Uncharacterized protein n=1 Tax=Wuchereria bancrofti TaxID=6293 RepID=A0A3P7F9Z7_WUCBA|nr:unnamed protein product [Wuchereria bancrofti]